MSTAIRIKGIGKEYQIGARERGYGTFRETVMQMATAPWRRFRRLAGQTTALERFWAIRQISFDVQEGEVVGIMGRNGAGKSTLLKILSQITEPTEGEIDLHGRVGSLLEVGTGFHPELTGRENVYLNGAILGMKRAEIERRFDEIVAFSEIEQFLDTPVKRYSSGMYTRLAFSVAAHFDPEIMIVDEVLAVGDAAFQEKCLGKMNQASQSGRTVLFVSHNTAAVESLCTRAIVLVNGRVTFDGNPKEAVQSYLEHGRPAGHSGLFQRDDDYQPTNLHGIRITKASITSGGKDCGACFAIGAPLEVVVELAATEQIPQPEVAVGIMTDKGVRLVTFHTRCDPSLRSLRNLATKYRFECTVPDLALTPGKYTVYLGVLHHQMWVEAVENALTFTVLRTDYFNNSGKYVAGSVFCKQRWQVETLG